MINMVKQLIERSRIMFSNLDAIPLQLDITNKCNLKCRHCYQSTKNEPDKLSFNDWTSVLDQFFALTKSLYKKPLIYLCGGEPFISKHLVPIIEYAYAKDNQTQFFILSNGTYIRDDVLALLKPFNPKFSISVDGPSAKQHDFVRGNGSFDKTALGIKKLQAAGFSVDINCVLSRNACKWLKDFFQLAQELKVSKMKFTRFIESGEGLRLVSSGQDGAPSSDELKTAYQDIISLEKITGVQTNTDNPLFCLVNKSKGAQMAAGETLVIDYNGAIKVSSKMDLTIGNVLTNSLINTFLTHPTMIQLRKRKQFVCNSCKYSHQCGGDLNVIYARFGSFEQIDPGCWKASK